MIKIYHQKTPSHALFHIQSNALRCCYSSIGVNGSTSKHSMRLINTRFSNENKFFGMRELQL
jgi:cytochrome c peroxidase